MMNENEKRLSILKTENPFTSSSVGDPWEEKYPDVESINKHAFDQISQLIDQKMNSPALPCAGLIFGEVGSGKTHLITRILKYGKRTRFPFSFAYVQPIEAPEQTYRYFLREIMVNLCYPIDKSSDKSSGTDYETHPRSQTQLDVILAKSFKEAIEKNQMPPASSPASSYESKTEHRISDAEKSRTQKPASSGMEKIKHLIFEFKENPMLFFKQKKIMPEIPDILEDMKKSIKAMMKSGAVPNVDTLEKRTIDFMRIKFPDIPKEFFKVLFQYQMPKKRAAAVEWLKGAPIDEEDAALLGVTDRLSDSPAVLEQKARSILGYLGTLMEYYRLPLVVCFDRLENYDTDDKIRSLGKMVEFLVDKAKAMLPLAFVRGQQWEERFTKKLNQQVITRLKTNEFKLKGCDSNQALEIIESRLSSVLGRSLSPAERGDKLFPFDAQELENTFKTRLYSPRQVIILANQRLKQILYPDKEEAPLVKILSPLDKLQDEFESQCRIIHNDFDRYQPDRSRLRRALELYLNHPPAGRFETESLTSPDDKYIDSECKIKFAEDSFVHGVFIIDIEANNASVRASLSRGVDFLENQAEGKAVYIRDVRCAIPPPPQWKATNEMLDRFKELGGNIVFLDQKQASEWYALALLNYAVKEGDITIIDADNQPRGITAEDLAEFVQKNIHTKDCSGFQRINEMIDEWC